MGVVGADSQTASYGDRVKKLITSRNPLESGAIGSESLVGESD